MEGIGYINAQFEEALFVKINTVFGNPIEIQPV